LDNLLTEYFAILEHSKFDNQKTFTKYKKKTRYLYRGKLQDKECLCKRP